MTSRASKISRPPRTENIDLNAWMQEIKSRFDNYIQSLFVPVSKSGIATNLTHGKHPVRVLSAGDSGYFGFVVPESLSEFKEVTIRFIPTVNGTIDYTVNLSYGGIGQDENANARTSSATGFAVVDDQLTEIDITTLFTSLTGGVDQPDHSDEIGVELKLDAVGGGTTDIQVLNLYLKYI